MWKKENKETSTQTYQNKQTECTNIRKIMMISGLRYKKLKDINTQTAHPNGKHIFKNKNKQTKKNILFCQPK